MKAWDHNKEEPLDPTAAEASWEEETSPEDLDDLRKQLASALTSNDNNPEDLLEKKELRERLLEGIDKLPPEEAEVIRMRFGIPDEEGLSYDGVAKVLNMNPWSVKTRETRAIHRLRSFFK